MNDTALHKELAGLYKKNELLSEVLKKFSFTTEEEAKQYVAEHDSVFDELKTVRERIRAIEWELKAEEEKKEHEEYIRKLKDKYKED